MLVKRYNNNPVSRIIIIIRCLNNDNYENDNISSVTVLLHLSKELIQ